MNVNLYLVSSLLHAAACAETSPAAISIPVGNLLHVYEQNRVPDDLMTHPGVQAIQSILAYFRFNGIKTKVIGMSFRSLPEIGLLSEFDAVGVSGNQADGLKWSKVPTISLDNVDLPTALRGRQAKYPTDLLTQKGGFLASLSPVSRNLINTVLGDALGKMQGEMDAIEDIVGKEVDRQFRLGTLDLKTLYKSTAVSPERKSIRKNSRESAETTTTREIEILCPAEADPMDEVF
ncbi:hypothetical protein BYT27DRAFT_7198501 [Phlegmacium glaucopus]|nr:hypothetical protein BYT27DRAFT_7198501 [Phlegmacium glaucopus]